MRRRTAILISGRGSNMAALLAAARDPAYPAEIALVLSNRADAAGLTRAVEAGIATSVVESRRFGRDRAGFEAAMEAMLARHGVELIAMAGFGTILEKPVHDAFAGRIVNTHPALLPSFRGWHAVRDALEFGVKVTGVTVHLAMLEVDDGPILAQEAVAVRPDDTEASLHERIKVIERRLYPEVIAQLVQEHDSARENPPEGT